LSTTSTRTYLATRTDTTLTTLTTLFRRKGNSVVTVVTVVRGESENELAKTYKRRCTGTI